MAEEKVRQPTEVMNVRAIRSYFSDDEIRAMFISRKFERVFVDVAVERDNFLDLDGHLLVWQGYELAMGIENE